MQSLQGEQLPTESSQEAWAAPTDAAGDPCCLDAAGGFRTWSHPAKAPSRGWVRCRAVLEPLEVPAFTSPVLIMYRVSTNPPGSLWDPRQGLVWHSGVMSSGPRLGDEVAESGRESSDQKGRCV